VRRCLVGLGLVLGACGSGSGRTDQVPVPPRGGPVVAPVPSGYWSGDWGRLVLAEDGRGAYDHDDGTVMGAMQGDTFVGWWCEVPSRAPDQDAGEVELRFVEAADGTTSIDGRWRYGTDGGWREDWDLTWDVGEPPAELVARFDDPSAFCAHP